MLATYDVNEIFYSIEGEGIRAGYISVFIRLNGCNLRCSYCDTEYAQFKSTDNKRMTLKGIYKAITAFGKVDRITITGGEPLLHENIYDLIRYLENKGYQINVETNGTIVPPIYGKNIIYTMDYKCPSSGMCSLMNFDAIHFLREIDVLKFVVGNKEDMEHALLIIKATGTKASIYFSPVFGKIDPVEIVNFLKDRGLNNVRLQLQMHKIIWKPEQRGV